jgi:hypothetical protein
MHYRRFKKEAENGRSKRREDSDLFFLQSIITFRAVFFYFITFIKFQCPAIAGKFNIIRKKIIRFILYR